MNEWIQWIVWFTVDKSERYWYSLQTEDWAVATESESGAIYESETGQWRDFHCIEELVLRNICFVLCNVSVMLLNIYIALLSGAFVHMCVFFIGSGWIWLD